MDLVSWTFANEPEDLDRPVSVEGATRFASELETDHS
jgi:hypothetical protein